MAGFSGNYGISPGNYGLTRVVPAPEVCVRTLVLTLLLPDLAEDSSRARQVFEALSEYQAAVFANNRAPFEAPEDAVGLNGNGTFTAANGVVVREGMA